MIYLNNAASSWPKAPGLADAVSAALNAPPEHGARASGGIASPAASGTATDALETCRAACATLLGLPEPDAARRIVLCQNATHALNLALLGFPFRRHDLVLTTAAEHNAVLRPLYRLKRLGRIRLHILPVDATGRVSPDAWTDAVQRLRPRLVVLGHASNVTGALQDVAPLFAAARAAGCVTLLDAAQSLGLTSVNVHALHADLLAFTGHKYLLGPPGTGGLYIGPAVIASPAAARPAVSGVSGTLRPVLTGGTGVRSDLTTMPPDLPGRFEPGTPNTPAYAGLAHALAWQAAHPLDPSALHALTTQLADGLRTLGAHVHWAAPPCTPVLAFTLPGWTPDDTAYALHHAFDIVCRAGLHCAPLIHTALSATPHGTVRLSLSRFTTAAEVAHTLDALTRISA